MKVIVVIPDEAYRNAAGARIRYGRIRAEVEALGGTLDTEVADNFRRGTRLTHDAYIFAKCNDTRPHLLARTFAAAGKRVGVDLFDDYVSQAGDTRFAHMRRWLSELRPHLDFALCSTPRMRRIADALLPDVPAHVMNDPHAGIDRTRTIGAVASKLARAAATRTFRIGWFGRGDSRNFSVGLRDVVAYGDALRPLRGRGFEATLTLLTNTDALTPAILEALRRLPIHVEAMTWTETAEAALVADSDACFLPVNGSHFSVAKSLNRAITALTGGAQVLSAGYPLYGALGPLVYRDATTLRRDLEAGTPALREETWPEFARMMHDWADPSEEARRLLDFLRSVPPRTRERDARSVAAVHGRRSNAASHKLVQRLGGFSVTTPFSDLRLNSDAALLLRPGFDGLDLHLSEALAACLSPAAASRVSSLPEPVGRLTRVVRDVAAAPDLVATLRTLRPPAPATLTAALAGPAWEATLRLLRELLPGVRIIPSEWETLVHAGVTEGWTEERSPGMTAHAA